MIKHFKKLITLMTTLFLVINMITATAFAAVKDGTYTGKSSGNGGDIEVEVVIKDQRIAEINTIHSQETKGLGEGALEKIKKAIIANNTVNVDTISGATDSSQGYIDAVKEALKAAGATEDDFMSGEMIKHSFVLDKEEYTFDVVVLGGGGAGLSSAVEAANLGASVVVVEKSSAIGGNTAVSGGAFNVPGSDLQKNKDIEDSVEKYIEDTLKGGDELSDPELVKVLGENALSAYEWMRDVIHAEFIPDRVQQFGGHSTPRSVVPIGNKGIELTDKLWAAAEAKGAQLFLDTKATELIQENGTVVGVKVENNGKEIIINANKGVIVATGGFAANIEMREKYNAAYGSQYLTTAVPASTGDGIAMCENIGAQLVDMEQIQVYPTCNPLTGIISYVANARFDGALLINQEGQRFINESGRRDEISNAILEQPGGYAYLVWGQEIETVGNMTQVHKNEFEELKKNNLLFEAATLEELAATVEMDAAKLAETIAKFNGYVPDKNDPDFNKTGAYRTIAEGPFYIQKVMPATHHTMGGVKININAQVLDTEGNPIPNLFAAGEVVGGIHGTNRLGGNAITDIIVFGRIAGVNAVNGVAE
ncbi:flavocytochrome c [Aerococcaceae bacterium NML201209]|nr:flavocytochrome c [Aerococcaceae bacterium NML201209]